MKKKHISAYRGASLDPNRITKKKKPERISAYSKAETNRGGLLEGTGYVAGRLGLGIAGVGEGLGDIVSAGGDLLRGDTEMAKYRFLDNRTAEAQQSLTDWYNPGKGMQFAGDVASGVGQSSVFLLDALVPGLGTGMFFTGITGQSVAGAAQQTGDVGWRELGYGVASGAAEAALGKLVGAGGKVAGKLGSSLTRSTGKAIGQRGVTTALTKATGKKLAGMGWNVAKNTLADAAGEFTEEFAAEYIDTGLQRLFGIDPNASTSFGEALRAGAVGFVSGAAMGAPANVYNYNNSVAAGRAIREEGGVDQLLYRAAATVDVLKEQEAQAREKGRTKATVPEDAGLVGKTAAKGKQAVANLGAKITASKTKGYWSKLEKNINAYMNMDEAMRNSDVGDALLGELRGNLFFTNMSYAVEEAEEALQNATDEEITGWLVEVNDKAKKAGKADANYTVEDFRANKDGILSTVAAAFWIDEIRRTANGTKTDETATESPAEPAQAPKDTTAEEVTAQEENDATEATEAAEPDPWESIEGIEGFGTQNAQEEALLRAASSQGVPKRTVPAMLKSYREGTDLTPAEFAEAWGDGVMFFGRLGLNESAINKDSPLARVGENARRASIQEGKTIADEELKRAKEKAEKKKMPARNQADATRKQEGRGAVVKGKGLIVRDLDEAQYAAYKAAETFAAVLGTDIVIETDLKTDTGKQINGFYSKKTNGIHININAKRNGKSIALYTLGHEVTHYIKAWSPEKFRALSDFVLNQLGDKAPDLIAAKAEFLRKMPDYKDYTVTQLNDLAVEEVVADSMELVLSDGKILDELARTEKTVWQKIKDFITEIIADIRKYYGELSQATKTAQVLKETVDSLDEIEQLFYEGVTEAGERTRTAEAGVIVDEASGTAMLSVDDISKTERRTTDTAYLAAVERGDMVIAQRMVNEAAKKWGAIVDETTKTKRPLHLYHGSRDFGFTRFNERAIFATVKESVAAGYNSGAGLGRVRNASVKYIPNDGTVETAIKNAKSVLGRDLSRLNDSAKQEIVSKADSILKEVARRISDIDEAIDYSKAEKFFDYLAEKYGEDASMKWTNQLDNMKYMISGEYTAEEILEDGEWLEHDLEKYSEWKRSLNELWLEEREEIESATLGEAFRYVLGYDYGDKVIDIEFGLGRLLNEREKLVNPNGSLVYLDDIIADIEDKKSTGVYDLYGHAGEKPLIIDEGNRFWDAIPFDGGFRSTDYIVKWAKDHGYTSVNLKSIMDPSAGGSENVYADEWVFFSSDQVKSAAPVTYDDSGNVIPLSERFKEGNSDIRYSIDDTPETPDVSDSAFDEALRRAGLSHLVEDTAEAETTETAPPPRRAPQERDPEEVRRDRIRAHETLANALMEAAQNEHEFRLVKNYQQKAAELADAEVRKEDLRKKTAEVNREIDALQDKLKGVDKTKREPWVMTALTDAQKRKGELLDEMDALDEKLRAETDKLLSLAYAKQLRKLIRAERSKAAAMERSAERARQREMDSKERAKETVKKAREESEEKVKKARQEAQDYKAAVYKTSMDKVYKARREATDYKRAVYHTAYAKADEKNQKYRDKLDEMAKQSMERREITSRKRAVQKILGNLNTMLYHPNRQKHVPEELRGLTETVLASADPKKFAVNRDHIREMSDLAAKIERLERKVARTAEEQTRLEKMKSKYEHLEDETISVKRQAEALLVAFKKYQGSVTTSAGFDQALIDKMTADVERIEEASLKEMTLESLKAVENFYTMLKHQIDEQNNLFMQGKEARVSEFGNNATTEASDAKPLKFLSPKSMELKGMANIRQFFWKNMKPLTVFEAIGSDTFTRLFQSVLNGENVWARDIEEARGKIVETRDKYGYDKWELDKRVEVKDKDGKTVRLSLSEMMSLYAYAKRKQAMGHLEGGGFVLDPGATEMAKGKVISFADMERRLNHAERHVVDQMIIGEITSKLTAEQKAYVDEMQTYLTKLGERGNTVSRKLYGIDIFTEEYYFPIKVKSEYLESHTGRTGDPNIKNRGMTKEVTPEADNPLVLQGFDAVMVDHINSMATYHAFVLPVEDLTRVLNYKPSNAKIDEDGNWTVDESRKDYSTLKAVIEEKYGAEANHYIEQLIRDLNGGARRDAAATLLDKGITGFKRASTMASLSVLIQQPTSLIRAAAYIDPKYLFGQASIVDFANHKKLWERLCKYAPVGIIKEMGGYDTGVGARTGDYLNAKVYKTPQEKLEAFFKPERFGGDSNYRAEVFGKGAAYADEMAWIQMFEACVSEQADKLGKSRDSEEVLKAAGKRFEEVVRRTQVYDSTLTRTEYMRSKDTGMKMATAFMAEPSTVVSMVADAIMKAERGDTAFLRRTAGAVAGAVIINALASSLVYAMRDDDEEKTYGEKYVASVAMEAAEAINPLEYLPYFRDIMSIMKGYEIERTDMTLISNLFQQVELLTNSKRTVGEKVLGVSGAVSAFFGIPMTNLTRDAKGIVNTVMGGVDTERGTAKGMSAALKEEFSGIFGLFDEQTKNEYQIYQAYVSGDTAHYNRVKARYKSDQAAELALRQALRDNDPRISEAAEAKHTGDLAVYESIVDQIESEGIFDRNIVIRAVNNEVSEIKRAAEKGELVPKDETATDEEAPESLYTASDLNAAMERGDTEDFAAIMAALVQDKVSTGKTEAQAKASVKSSITAYWKKQYLNGYQDTETRKRIIAILTETGLYGSRNDVATMCEGWVKASK